MPFSCRSGGHRRAERRAGRPRAPAAALSVSRAPRPGQPARAAVPASRATGVRSTSRSRGEGGDRPLEPHGVEGPVYRPRPARALPRRNSSIRPVVGCTVYRLPCGSPGLLSRASGPMKLNISPQKRTPSTPDLRPDRPREGAAVLVTVAARRPGRPSVLLFGGRTPSFPALMPFFPCLDAQR